MDINHSATTHHRTKALSRREQQVVRSSAGLEEWPTGAHLSRKRCIVIETIGRSDALL
jgi:hypothetical protein